MVFFQSHISWVIAFVLALVLVGGYRVLVSAPVTFSANSIVTISRGASAPQVAEQLAKAHIISYPSILQLLLRVSGMSNSVQAGTYRFDIPQNIFTIARRITTGAYGFPPVHITFVEGTTIREIATSVAEAFSGITTSDFMKEAQSYEGYLFPDTYLFAPSSDTASIVATMRENFNTKISALSSDIALSEHSLSDIVIMASLIEKEARTTAVRKTIAGILWNRLRLGMPLQVDAVFGYIFNRDTYSPLFADLKVDSPYNTYTHTGLPPGPINNPGLDSLEAALHPTETNYLYYLTDSNGVMHYATTYAGHQANQRKYLK